MSNATTSPAIFMSNATTIPDIFMSNATTIPAIIMSNATTSPSYPLDPGDTAWMLASTALVMLMTPGLSFFYGGLVKGKNMINTMMMSFGTLGLITVQWVLFGYTFSFGGGNSMWGDFSYAGLINVGPEPNPSYSTTIPHVLYSVYQLMFGIITAAIVSGGVVERMKFIPFLVFIFIWTTIVYDPIAHWLWSAYMITLPDGTTETHFGWLRQLGALDFAGGNVVHISSGVSALVAAAIVGPRPETVIQIQKKKKDKKNRPAHLPYVILGAALLWFGWFGFNSGSALSASGLAVIAFVNTQVATAVALTVWMILEMVIKGSASAEGATSGAVVGLVAITPCAGYIHPQSSLAIGAVAAIVCYYSVLGKAKYFPRHFPQLDDSLDVFTCHAVGGAVGSILLGFFSSTDINPGGLDGAFFGNPIMIGYQVSAVVSTITWSAFFTALILLPLKYTVGLSPHQTVLRIGMDKGFHGSAQTGFEPPDISIAPTQISQVDSMELDAEEKKEIYQQVVKRALNE